MTATIHLKREREMKRAVYFLCCWVPLTLLFPYTCNANEGYAFSMLPRYFPKKIRSMIEPVAGHLTESLGVQVTPVLTKDFTEYENRLKNGDIEIGYENPLVYTKVSLRHEVLAMAVKGAGGDRFRGIVIARPDSEIQGVEDLKHKKIIIVGKTSAGGFLSQKLSLAGAGIDVEKDCLLEEASNNKQENVIISVSIGDADAGFIRESALHIADQYIQPGTIKVVAPCAWLPNWALSVDRNLPSERKVAIQAAMVGLSGDSPVLKAMGISGFKAATDAQYDVVRRVAGP
jgi:phosphonate transport system substrate-binding protein